MDTWKKNVRFMMFVLGVIAVTGLTLWVNNYSKTRLDAISQESIECSQSIQKAFLNTQNEVARIGGVVNDLIQDREGLLGDEALLAITENEIHSMLGEYAGDHLMVRSYFYQIGSRQSGEALESLGDQGEVRAKLEERDGAYWAIRESDPFRVRDALLFYILALRQGEELVGFLGVEAEMDYVKEEMKEGHSAVLTCEGGGILYHPGQAQIEKETGMGESEFYGVVERLSGQRGSGYRLERLNKVRYLYSYQKFPTGQTYIAVQRIGRKLKQSNALIVAMAVISVLIVAFTGSMGSGGRPLLESVADGVIVRFRKSLSPQSVKGQKSVVILQMAMVGAILTDSVYAFILGKGWKAVIEYLAYALLVVMLLVFLFLFSKKGLTKRKACVVSVMGLVFPIVEHVGAGGFHAGRAGDGMLWLIVALFVALFIVGEKDSIAIFNLFVVVLFLDLLVEIFYFDGLGYEKLYGFVTGFFFLGLACFASMGVYESGSRRDYKKEEALIKQLNSNQSLLVQNEKLGTLGQLVSSVAHDINTPVGAIKASIETMDASYEKVLWTLIRAGQEWDELDYECFEHLIVSSLYSKSQMKSTREIREGKKVMLRYLEANEVVDAPEIVRLLVNLEIVDLVHVEPCLFLFHKGNVKDILYKVVELSSFLSGIPITIYAAERISDLVQALKSYVHSNAQGERMEFDVRKSIDNVLLLYHHQIKSYIDVETDYEEDLPTLRGNPDEIAQVWTNLIQNAIDEMKEKGGMLYISVKRKGEGVLVEVSDTGGGIPEPIRGKIFAPFFTTKKVGSGSGLGLNIVQKAVENNGGTIRVESKQDEGTKFILYFPASA